MIPCLVSLHVKKYYNTCFKCPMMLTYARIVSHPTPKAIYQLNTLIQPLKRNMYFQGLQEDKKQSFRNCPFLKVLQISFEAFFETGLLQNSTWFRYFECPRHGSTMNPGFKNLIQKESSHVSKYLWKNKMPTSAALVSGQCPIILQTSLFLMTSRNLFYTAPCYTRLSLKMRAHAYLKARLIISIRLYFVSSFIHCFFLELNISKL